MDDAIAERLVQARRTVSVVPDLGGAVHDLDDAYRIQDRMIRILGQEVVGWKIGMIPPAQRREGVRRFLGPIHRLLPSSSTIDPLPGGMVAEAELLVQIDGASLRDGLDERRLEAAVLDVRAGIEIGGSAVADLARHGAPALAADLGNHLAMVAGDPVAMHAAVDLLVDGRSVGRGDVDRLEGGLLAALAEGLTVLAERRRLPGGPTWFATGALSGAHAVEPGSRIEARFDGGTTLTCRIGDR